MTNLSVWWNTKKQHTRTIYQTYAKVSCEVLWGFVKGVLGIASVAIKVNDISFTADGSLLEWTPSQWVLFLAFVNNMIGIYDKADIDMDRALIVLFGRYNAALEAEELAAIKKSTSGILASLWHMGHGMSIFEKTVATCTINAGDLQKILIKPTRLADSSSTPLLDG